MLFVEGVGGFDPDRVWISGLIKPVGVGEFDPDCVWISGLIKPSRLLKVL